MNSAFAIAGVVIKELYRRKDFYVLFVLTALITLLLGMVNFFNDPKIVRYLKEVCLLLIWISSLVIAIGTAARQIPAERENRTIFPLLAKPVTRGQVVLGKFLGCWSACGVALLVFYLFFGIVSESRGRRSPPAKEAVATVETNSASAEPHDHSDHNGSEAASEHHDEQETASQHSALANYSQALWLHWMMLGVVTAMVLLGSVVFTAPSVSITVSFIGVIGILLLGEHLNKVALQQAQPIQAIIYTGYFLIPHLEWFDIRDRIIYDHAPIAIISCVLATLYALAYAGLFLFLTWFGFRRKTLTL